MIINNKYIIESVIGSGSFGNVYKATYINKNYAIKQDVNLRTLKYEATIYKELRNINNISQLVDFFFFDNNYYLVLNFYEQTLLEFKQKYYSLNDYHKYLSKIFSIIINTLKYIHDRGIVHRDLKPTNICLDIYNNPYIIDFGIAKKIIINKKHIQQKSINNIIGSENFVSLNVINLVEPSRRDDIESIIYVIIYMLLLHKITSKVLWI